MERSTDDLLVPGGNCWRVARADAARVLVDADAYFRAVYRAIRGARRSVLVVGWDLHSRTRLVRAGDPEGAGVDETLWDVLRHAVEARPRLRVHLLLWDWAILYAAEREPIPRVNLDWRLPGSVRLALDDAIPPGGSHHQKIVVVDDAIAFCGGLDLTIRRWDTRDHREPAPDRVDPDGAGYPPFHDVQAAVTGPAAAALGELARERWAIATGETLEAPPRGEGAPALAGGDADLELPGMAVGIARTLPARGDAGAVTEVKRSLLDAIGRAERTIYVENQFVCSDAIAEALERRLREAPRLEVAVIAPRTHDGWLEGHTMGAGRARFVHRLEEARVLDRVRLVYPVVPGEDGERDVFVHSKVMVVDDRWLRVGSANLNNRSMGYDSECDSIFAANDARERAAVARVRDELLAEHLGAEAATVAASIARHGLVATVERLGAGRRGVRPLEQEPGEPTGVEDLLVSIADPERPVRPAEFLSHVAAEHEPVAPRRPPLAPVIATVAVAAALAAVWKLTPVGELARPEVLRDAIASARASAWLPAAVLAGFVAGGLVMFPVTVLIVATGLAFGGLAGFAYACAGSVLSAVATYALGRWLGRGAADRLLGPRLRAVAAAVRRRSLAAMVTLRLVPIAPFTVVNFVAGATRIPFREYVAGTVLGMAPGIAVMTALGGSLAGLVTDLSWRSAAEVGVVAALWAALVWGAQRAFRSRGSGGG